MADKIESLTDWRGDGHPLTHRVQPKVLDSDWDRLLLFWHSFSLRWKRDDFAGKTGSGRGDSGSASSSLWLHWILDCMMGSIVKSALPLPVQISLQMNLCNCQFNGTYEEQKSSLERWQWLCQLDLMIIASLSTSIGAASSAKHARYPTQAGTWQVHVESCCSSSVEWLGGLQITDTPPQWTNWMFCVDRVHLL
jgi:hypothetical protein